MHEGGAEYGLKRSLALFTGSDPGRRSFEITATPLRTLNPAAGAQFGITVVGTGLDATGRLRIASAMTNPVCLSPTTSLFVTDPNEVLGHAGVPGPTGDGATSRIWPGLSINTTGTYRVCWCVGDSSASSCVAATSFNHDLGLCFNASIESLHDIWRFQWTLRERNYLLPEVLVRSFSIFEFVL